MNARYDFARRYMNHIFSEEGVAIIDSGARERSLTQFGAAGTFQGELGRTLFQFKAYPWATYFAWVRVHLLKMTSQVVPLF